MVEEVFKHLYHFSSSIFPLRLFSRHTNDKGEPLIIIEPENKNILILKFINSYPPKYTFSDLMKEVLCYAKYNGYIKVKLDDDALFVDKKGTHCEGLPCKYRALIYRVFMNKSSLYIDQGFVSNIDTTNMRNIIYNFKIKDAKNLAIRLDSPYKEVILKIPFVEDDNKFGEWIIKQHCCFMRGIINKLNILKNNPAIKTELNKNSIIFLFAYNQYYEAHKNLTKNT